MDESAPSAATGTAGAQRLIQKGAEIAGGAFASLAGTATGLVVAGPEGALVGGVAGSSITMAFRWLGQEMSSRLLGPRKSNVSVTSSRLRPPKSPSVSMPASKFVRMNSSMTIPLEGLKAKRFGRAS